MLRHVFRNMKMKELKLFIGGEEVAGTYGKMYDNIFPATGEVISKVHVASEADIDKAVASAKTAQKAWAKVSPKERGEILYRAGQILRVRNNEIAMEEVLDVGKPIQEADCADVDSAWQALEFFGGGAVTLMSGEYFDLGNGSHAYTRREAIGVVGCIGAWNYPIQGVAWKSAPALLAGNAVIFKPSEYTPTTALTMAKVYKEAGLPDGLFNVVLGYGDVGACLVNHKDIHKISLTGSVPTGKKIMQACSADLKHLTLELGGKSPVIVFDDADIDNAVSGAMMANFYTQGEVCSNGTRVFVQEGIYDAFMEKLISRTKKMTIGDPRDADIQIGAMIHEEQFNKVMGYINRAKDAGLELVCGGNRATVAGCEKGFFIEPTIFTNVPDDAEITMDEVFGAVMGIYPFKQEDEVIRRANDTIFGLSAGIFTLDIQKAHRVIGELQAGTCWINNYNLTPTGVPFGGFKQSGFGRENCQQSLDAYTQIKSVYVEGGDVETFYA